jgi:putative transposase
MDGARIDRREAQSANAYDNAMCQSFFATLECEQLDRHKFKNRVDARMAVFDFIEGSYNPHRRRVASAAESPINYERRQLSEPKCEGVHLSTEPG